MAEVLEQVLGLQDEPLGSHSHHWALAAADQTTLCPALEAASHTKTT